MPKWRQRLYGKIEIFIQSYCFLRVTGGFFFLLWWTPNISVICSKSLCGSDMYNNEVVFNSSLFLLNLGHLIICGTCRIMLDTLQHQQPSYSNLKFAKKINSWWGHCCLYCRAVPSFSTVQFAEFLRWHISWLFHMLSLW